MSEHTGEEWKINKLPYDMGPQFEISSDEHNFWIAKVGAPSEDPEVAEANAHLFIAAPDLLEACLMEEKAIALFDIWEQSGNNQAAWDAWQDMFHQSIKLRQAAIAKATREAQDD